MNCWEGIGRTGHATARLDLSVDGRRQSQSGLFISPQSGPVWQRELLRSERRVRTRAGIAPVPLAGH